MALKTTLKYVKIYRVNNGECTLFCVSVNNWGILDTH